MLTRLIVRRFKRFEDIDVPLGDTTLFVGPNNSGKTQALQAISLWNEGVLRWLEMQPGNGDPREPPRGTLDRRDLTAIPIPSTEHLWRRLQVREPSERRRGRPKNLTMEVTVKGEGDGGPWTCGMEFEYANELSLYCRPFQVPGGTPRERTPIPEEAANVRTAFLTPMSGLISDELQIQPGALRVRIGEGRTAEILRNLCFDAYERSPEGWNAIVARIEKLFGIALDPPEYVPLRGEIRMTYRERDVRMSLIAAGRGVLQTLLLLAWLHRNPGSVLLLDEPDAHLEILRQRQTHDILTQTARENGSQLVIATHSEVLLNEGVRRGNEVVGFVGPRPRAVEGRRSQLLKALRDITFSDYIAAVQTGWALYLEGSTDLAILRRFAERLGHPARELLQRPFVHYVGNDLKAALHHFHGLREAEDRLRGVALFDRRRKDLPFDPFLRLMEWERREIENYLCSKQALLSWAGANAPGNVGPLFAALGEDRSKEAMKAAIERTETGFSLLRGRPPWDEDLKAGDEVLSPVFSWFFENLGLPNRMPKNRYHELVPHVPKDEIAPEVSEKLDAFVEASEGGRPDRLY